MKNELVKTWMTRDVITISPDTTLPEADRLMVDNHIRRLPVVKNGRLVGIVTRNNLRSAAPSEQIPLNIHELHFLIARLTVSRVMTVDPVTISPETTIGQAVAIMRKNKFSGLPVVDQEQRVVGIITESDIFRMLAQTWAEEGS